MASAAADEGFERPNYGAKPENEELQAVKSDGINELIFVMLQQNPDPESGIQQATKLLTSMNQHLFQITTKIQEKQFEEREANNRLYDLEYKERSLRSMWRDKGKKMAALKRELDKLTFANNAYKDRSCINTQDKINIHNLRLQMHHGTGNMAKEKKLLKEVNAYQRKLNNHSDPGPSVVEEISDRIWRLRLKIGRNYFIPRPAMMVDEKKLRKEIDELKWARDRAFANAPLKGKIWNSLPSKNHIKQQIKMMEEEDSNDDEETRKEHMKVRGEIKVVKRQIKGLKKNIACLERQLSDVRRKKGEAYKVVLKLVKIQNQGIC